MKAWILPCLAVSVLSLPGCSGSSKRVPDPVAAPKVPAQPVQTPEQKLVSDLGAFRWDQLGNPVVRWDSIPPVRAEKEKAHRLLVVLVEFADLGFERYRGDAKQGEKLAAWYQEQLFDDSYQRKDTLSHYYWQQSDGAYHVTGTVLPPIKLTGARRAYGGPNRPIGGNWRNDVDPQAMVEESLAAVGKQHADLPWGEYDRWDPEDHDEDGNSNESDGYLDHFVLVFAGGGQSSCQLLNKLNDALTPNVGNEAVDKLDKRQRECADRLWPHRGGIRKREGEGPSLSGTINPRGGAEFRPGLWAFDYNMQSEYTAASTFIHEFGHSIGLPDVYARTSSNSTGGWELMSGTSDPSPQNLSAWSLLQLGWLEPRVILPPAFGGDSTASLHLGLASDGDSKADDAVMVVLPPKRRVIELTSMHESGGEKALYSGQGNELNRTAELSLDLTEAESASLEFDAWWEIEGGWDFAYVEASADGGKTWERLAPTDPRHMPAKHGHDGKNTKPGLTGRSGDLDGDGKNESNPSCDPTQELKHGEDKAEAEKNPCEEPTWVSVGFALDAFVGQSDLRFRVRYYTDGAAVERGILIDNVAVSVNGASGQAATFEEDTAKWVLDGFSVSGGRHELLVPHYYLLEYRDPYEDEAYDVALAEPGYFFYFDPTGKKMMAVATRPRPGVVAWYFNGAYAWSENDPAINGPGLGYLLAVDANPNEITLPGFESHLTGKADDRDTAYELGGEEAQAQLSGSYVKTVCFVRDAAYRPRGDLPTKSKKCPKRRKSAPVEALTIDGKKAMYSYKVIGDYLPGMRDGFQKVSELVDTKRTKKGTRYRLRDRSLRHLHTYDDPFSPTTFERGLVFYEVDSKSRSLREVASHDYPAAAHFGEGVGSWLNPRLPFGGVAAPASGMSFEVAVPSEGAPAGTRASVTLEWSQAAPAGP